jgi:hypothetical protein
MQIKVVRLYADEIARRLCDEHTVGRPRYALRLENLSKLRDLNLQRSFGRPRWAPLPELLVEAVAGDDLVRVHEQDREQRPLPLPAEWNDGIPLADLERSQDPKLHGCPSVLCLERSTHSPD